MPDFDALAAEMAADLMLNAARSVTEHDVRRAFEDYEAAPDLNTAEAESLTKAVLDNVEKFGIDIDKEGS